jgi:hypothetical protein
MFRFHVSVPVFKRPTGTPAEAGTIQNSDIFRIMVSIPVFQTGTGKPEDATKLLGRDSLESPFLELDRSP